MKKLTIILLLVFVLVLSACTQETPIADTSEEPEETTNETVLKATGLDGSTVNLLDSHEEYIIVNFFTTWCGYCIEEMPYLNTVDKEENIKVYIVNVFTSENPNLTPADMTETLKVFKEDNGYDMEFVLDIDDSITSGIDLVGFPHTVIYNQERERIFDQPGAFSSAEEIMGKLE